MSSTKFRRSGGLSDDLTPEQRLDISQRRLAREVSTACDRFLRSRGIGPGKLYTYAGPVQAAGDPIAGRHGGSEAEAKRSERSYPRPSAIPFFHTARISEKRGNLKP